MFVFVPCFRALIALLLSLMVLMGRTKAWDMFDDDDDDDDDDHDDDDDNDDDDDDDDDDE